MDPHERAVSVSYRIAGLISREQKSLASRLSSPRFAQLSTKSCSRLPGWCSVVSLWKSPANSVSKRSGRFGRREWVLAYRLVDDGPR